MNKTIRLGAAAILALSLTACGSSSDDAKPKASDETIASISAQLEGLSAEERRDELIKLAKEEGGTLNVYSSNPEEIAQYAAEQFTEQTGIEVNLYRADAEAVERKMIEEAKADYDNQADVTLNSDGALYGVSAAGVLEKFSTPAAEGILPEVVKEDQIGAYFAPFVAAVNTDLTTNDTTTWKDFLTKYAGELAFVDADRDWFASVVNNMMETEGMTEDEAVQLFMDAAKGSQVVEGHTLVGELLAAGQIEATGSAYAFTINALKAADAPVEWEPPVTPIFAAYGAVGINKATDQPAASLLWIDWTLTDGMKIGLEHDNQDPTNPTYGGTLSEYIASGDLVPRDVKYITTEDEKWTSMYDEVLRNAG